MQGACKVPGSDTSIEVALMPSQIRMPGGRTLGILILSGRWPEQTDKTSRFARNRAFDFICFAHNCR